MDQCKKQFTVYVRPVVGKGKYARFCTDQDGYQRSIEVLQKYTQYRYQVKAAVESTGNTWYFEDVA